MINDDFKTGPPAEGAEAKDGAESSAVHFPLSGRH